MSIDRPEDRQARMQTRFAAAQTGQRQTRPARPIATREELVRLRGDIDRMAQNLTLEHPAPPGLSDPHDTARIAYRQMARRLSYLEKRLPEAAHNTQHSFNAAAKRNLRQDFDPS